MTTIKEFLGWGTIDEELFIKLFEAMDTHLALTLEFDKVKMFSTEAPPILYHGTSALRYYMAIQFNGLKADLPRFYEFDEKNVGWLYFTEDLEDAATYSLQTHYLDSKRPDIQRLARDEPNLYERLDAGLIISINANKLRSRLEKDPERFTMAYDRIRKTTWKVELSWWRLKGDLRLDEITPLKAVPAGKNQDEFLKIAVNEELGQVLGKTKPLKHDAPFLSAIGTSQYDMVKRLKEVTRRQPEKRQPRVWKIDKL